MHYRLQLIRYAFSLFVLVLFADGGARGAVIDNWANYRGPTEQGRADAARLALTWSESENVTWKTAIDGKAWSSPVVWGDRIFVTNATPEGSSLSIVCLDKNSGQVVYDKQLYSVPLPQYCHPFNSYASPSPVVEEGRVYVSYGSPYNACLESETGKVIWERTDFVCNHFRGPASSPFVYGNLLIVHFDGSDQQYVVGMDKQTGATVWRTDRTVKFDDVDPATGKVEREGDARKAFSTPMVMEMGGRPTLVSLGSMAVYGYEPESGKELWRLDFIGSHSGACRPVIAHGMIYLSTGSGGELWAIRPDDQGMVTDASVVWKHKRQVPRRPSVLVVDDLLFMVDDNGVATCLEAKTGAPVWTERLGNNFSASPISAQGRVYYFDETGKATVVKAAREFEILAVNRLDEGFMASPAVSGDALFLRTRTHLYRIEDAAAK